ncbi:acyl-CoA dehydrogenase family protein [Pseudonocardia sp. NPDC049154]|uniref:acyl-CoA dehydrogenase family protein n=1 Tax=Pseudonocardia sp. NPDC049154 TaxID=3155501 RepID=UPI0033D5E390
MDLTRSPEHEDLAATVRRIATAGDPVARARAALDDGPEVDLEAWTRLVALGVLEEGGLRDLVAVAEELGRALTCVPFHTVATAAAVLGAAPADGAIATLTWLPGRRGAVPTCTADADWVLRGTAGFVPFGAEAQLLLVPVTTPRGVGVAAVDVSTVDTSTVERAPLRTLDATRPQARIRFTGAPATPLVEPDATGVLAAALDRAGVLLAAEQLGTAQAALEAAVEYAGHRVQFGRPIGSFQAVKHLCADMLIGVESLRSAVRAAAWAADAASPDAPLLASLAQTVAADVVVAVADAAQHVHGGIGFTWEHPAHLVVRRCLADAAALGGRADHRLRLADRAGL